MQSEILLYATEDGTARIDVRLVEETVWLTQAQLALLFNKDKPTISEHIKNIFEEGEAEEYSVVREFWTTAADGKNYDVQYYNLDVIIAVGYRVKSLRGTQFRQWVTSCLREYIVKGFTLDDKRLAKLDDFLRLNDMDILQGLGRVSKQNADALAETEFSKYQEQKRVIDDAAAAEELDAEVKWVLASPKKPAARKKKD